MARTRSRFKTFEGYHLTSWSNWKNIQKEGKIKAYLIPPLYEYGDALGVWVWKRRPKGKRLLSIVIRQMETKGESRIVCLAISYRFPDVKRIDGRNLKVTHDCTIGRWIGHKKMRSIILNSDVPIERIRLVKSFDLVKMITKYDQVTDMK